MGPPFVCSPPTRRSIAAWAVTYLVLWECISVLFLFVSLHLPGGTAAATLKGIFRAVVCWFRRFVLPPFSGALPWAAPRAACFILVLCLLDEPAWRYYCCHSQRNISGSSLLVQALFVLPPFSGALPWAAPRAACFILGCFEDRAAACLNLG